MLIIKVKEGEKIDRVLKRYKNKFNKTKVMQELRDRKILLTKKEISKISKLSEVKGVAVVPLELFTLKGRFKLKVGVCRGKKEWDKRQDIKKRDTERELRRKDF